MRRGYAGMSVALGTMHGKQSAIAPALSETAGLSVFVPDGIDTDRFGTFTRDIARRGTMEDAAIAKAEEAIEASGFAIGLASEGSYGPHPSIPLIPGGRELLVLVDRSRNITITEHLVTADVTFANVSVRELDALGPFLRCVGFPAQRLVLRPADRPDAATGMTKGVADAEHLAIAFAVARSLSATGEVLVETDMRAFSNPRRMRSIGLLARRLGERLARHCPHCDAPGFGGDRQLPGLPCRDCGAPTSLPFAFERTCLLCGGNEILPLDVHSAEPAHCSSCNP